jgi:Fe-S cluster assembly iron-binding protein IscA
MNVKITRNAAKKMKEILEQEADKELKFRVYVTEIHGDHAHYELTLDKPGENDVVISTDKGVDIIVEKDEPLLDGVKINYVYIPEEQWDIYHPKQTRPWYEESM